MPLAPFVSGLMGKAFKEPNTRGGVLRLALESEPRINVCACAPSEEA